MLPAASNDLRSILNAAEEAVGRDDAVAAERLLRDALALQESTAGSPRDEVAKTLNNLAVVCEMTGKVADAETCYRRAYAIATATLPASDPFVTTSRENLEEFCRSQGIPFEKRLTPRPPEVVHTPAVEKSLFAPEPAPPGPAAPGPMWAAPEPMRPAPEAMRPASETPRVTPDTLRPASAVPAVPPPVRFGESVSVPAGRGRAILLAMLGVVAVASVIVGARYWLSADAPEQAAPISSPQPTTAAPPVPAATVPPAPVTPPPPVETPLPPVAATPEPPVAKPEPAPAPPKPEPPRTTAPSSSTPTVVSAELCRNLSRSGAWRCEPASGTVRSGTIYYYTKVASSRDAQIEHRWYVNDRLLQSVPLRIGANQSGFRTYSRSTITTERAGEWKVELRTSDGRVLHEDTFTVR